MNAIDRNLLTILNEPIKREFGLSDTTVGLMASAFAVGFACTGIPFGMAVDRWSRKRILIGCFLWWSFMTGICGLASSATALVAARFAVGAGEAGSGPAILSSVADLYPPERRATMTSILYLSVSIGFALAVGAGGWIAQAHGWRAAFIAGAVPAVPIALMYAAVAEPGRAASVAAAAPSISAFMKLAWHQKSLVWMIGAATLNVLIVSGLGAWTGSFLIRSHNLALRDVGLSLGTLQCVLGFAGTFVGGLLADRLGQYDEKARLWVVAAGCFTAAWAYGLFLWAGQLTYALALFGVYAFASSIWYGPVYALTQSVVSPAMRGTTAAMLYMLTNLVGFGLGSLVVGVLSDRLGGGLYGLRLSLLITAGLFIPAAILFSWASRSLVLDLKRAADGLPPR